MMIIEMSTYLRLQIAVSKTLFVHYLQPFYELPSYKLCLRFSQSDPIYPHIKCTKWKELHCKIYASLIFKPAEKFYKNLMLSELVYNNVSGTSPLMIRITTLGLENLDSASSSFL
jgi:hypothetical protein